MDDRTRSSAIARLQRRGLRRGRAPARRTRPASAAAAAVRAARPPPPAARPRRRKGRTWEKYARRVSEVTDLLSRLIQVDTTNPPGNETAAAELLRDYLEANGVDCELYARVPERANLVARIPGTGDGPSLLLLGHTDVVLADPSEWSRAAVLRRGARRRGLGPRRARHEEPGRRRGGRARVARPRGIPAVRRSHPRVDRRRGGRRRVRPPVAVRRASGRRALRLRRQRGRRRPHASSAARRSTSARPRRSSRRRSSDARARTLRPRVDAVHRGQRAHQGRDARSSASPHTGPSNRCNRKWRRSRARCSATCRPRRRSSTASVRSTRSQERSCVLCLHRRSRPR